MFHPGALLALLVVIPLTQATIMLDLDIPPRVTAGEPVAVVLRLRNTSPDSQTIYLRGRDIVADLTVTSGDQLVWRLLEGAVVPAIVHIRTLAPGEVVVVPVRWPGRDQRGNALPAGRYEVRGSVLTDGAPILSALASVEVIARP